MKRRFICSYALNFMTEKLNGLKLEIKSKQKEFLFSKETLLVSNKSLSDLYRARLVCFSKHLSLL